MGFCHSASGLPMCRELVQGGPNPLTGSFFQSTGAETRGAPRRISFDMTTERTASLTKTGESYPSVATRKLFDVAIQVLRSGTDRRVREEKMASGLYGSPRITSDRS